jgi:ATP/maltotriose-dependent transcriptional regulator MalT/DNA-binding SARP family transcriptional activator
MGAFRGEAQHEQDFDGAGALRRDRLMRRLDAASPARLMTIVAGAGFGKTTLLRHWSEDRKTVWHTVTPGDNTLARFAKSLTDALRLVAPRLATDVLVAVVGTRGPDTDPDEEQRADALAAMLSEELRDQVQGDIWIVLDDVDVLEAGSASARFVGALCRHAPDGLRVVVASRATIPFPIGRLRIEGRVTEIDGTDLAFTATEISELIQMHRLSIDSDALAAATGGWPAAVRLALRAGGTMEFGPHAGGASAGAPLYEYLAEEVLAAEKPRVVQTLAVMAELPWVDAELVSDLAGAEPGLLGELDRRGIYLTHTGGGRYELAPLMRDFIRTHSPLDAGARSDLLASAAAAYTRRDAMTEVVTCLLGIHAHDEVVDLLTERGRSLIMNGRASHVLGAIDQIPEHRRHDDLLVVAAEARQILGDWEGALRCYQQVIPETGPIPAAIAWRAGLLHHMRGAAATAIELYERGRATDDDPAESACLVGWMASAYWLRGDLERCRELADRSLQLAAASGDPAALAAAHTVKAMVAAVSGDRAANDDHYLKALDHAERAHDVLQTIRIRANRGSRSLEEGEFDTASDELAIALRLAESTGFATFRALTLNNTGLVHFHQGRLEEATADLEESRSLFNRLGSRLESYPLAHLGEVYRMRGDLSLARSAYEAAVELSEDPADLQGLVPALAGLAQVLAHDDPAAAHELADRALRNEDVLGHVSALLAAGRVALVTGDVDAALAWAHRASEVARGRRDRVGLAEALFLESSATRDQVSARRLLEQARSAWQSLGNPLGVARVDVEMVRHDPSDRNLIRARAAVEELVQRGAYGPAHAARTLLAGIVEAQRPALEFRALGGFTVVRHGEVVSVSEWQSRVARDLLKMLIANRGRPVHREVLIDRLWPDGDSDGANHRLSVALSTLRGVLDPDKAHERDRYLVADRETVALRQGVVTVDAEQFIERATRGLALLAAGDVADGTAACRAAVELYVGDFLEDNPYDEWAEHLREDCRALFLEIALALAVRAAEEGDFDAATRHYLRVLERDAFHEPAHLGLVEAAERSGRRGEARRLYGRYVARMSELGVEPASFPDG